MSSDSQRLASVFETLGLKRKTTTPKDLGLFHLSTWMMAMDDDYIDVEVDALVSDSSYYQKVVERFVTTKLEGMTTMTRVISREDLILHKLYAERLIDQADVISLMETHQEDLDFDYLQHWIQELKVESMWKTIQDRLPGDAANHWRQWSTVHREGFQGVHRILGHDARESQSVLSAK